jgi:superfamily II DNA/RNA helicase
MELLGRNPEILVATPGRLIDHMSSGKIDFSQLQMLVLDEADRMLDMGFIEDIERIVAATPASRQTMLFSATLDGTVGEMAQRMTRNCAAHPGRCGFGQARPHRAADALRRRSGAQEPPARPPAA